MAGGGFPKAVVLLSGGLDSAVCLAVARRDGFEPHAVSFDYAQRHRSELLAAARVATQIGAASHRTIAIDLRSIGGSALTSQTPVPKDRPAHELAQGIPVTYVPARNLVFLSVAVALGEVLGARDLFVGVNAVDYSGYPDCRPEFVEAFEHAARLGTRAGAEGSPFRVRAPLGTLSKPQIIRLGRDLGVDFSLTQSCYDPDPMGSACGACDSCQIRRAGFEHAGVPDPTRYLAGARP